jgi:hypothetical protein
MCTNVVKQSNTAGNQKNKWKYTLYTKKNSTSVSLNIHLVTLYPTDILQLKSSDLFRNNCMQYISHTLKNSKLYLRASCVNSSRFQFHSNISSFEKQHFVSFNASMTNVKTITTQTSAFPVFKTINILCAFTYVMPTYGYTTFHTN